MNQEEIRKRLEEEVKIISEEQNLLNIHDFVARNRIKLQNVATHLENGKVIHAHQKLQGVIAGLDHLSNMVAIRLNYMQKDNDSN